MLILLCILAISVVSLLTITWRLYLKWNFNYWAKRHVPGPKPQIRTGTFAKTSRGECNLIEELHEIYLKYKSRAKCVGLFTSRQPKLFILQPQMAMEVLTRNFTSFHDNESSRWTSRKVEQMRICSPFVSAGDTWKERRSELVPALTANRLKAFYPIMLDSGRLLVQFIRQYKLGVPQNAKELANRYTSQFIGNFIWGIEAQSFESSRQLSPVHQMAQAIITQALKCVNYYGRTADWPWLRRFQPVRFFPAAADKFFQQLTGDAIRQRNADPLTRCDVIDHLAELQRRKNCLTDIQIAGHSTTVLIDGYETGAIVMAHCLLLLARDQRVQQKLRDELHTDGSPPIDYDGLMALPYLDQCIQETLRLFPPLPTLFKLCTSPTTLKDSNVSLLPGDVVYISSYSFQHDPDYFEDPENFEPERFDADRGGIQKYRDLGVFLPFGDGPRMCLGMKLGMAEVKVGVSEIIRNFRVRCSPTTRSDNKLEEDSFLLTLKGGIELIFEEL